MFYLDGTLLLNGKTTSSLSPSDVIEKNSINNFFPPHETSPAEESFPVDNVSKSLSPGDDYNQWSEFWEQVSLSKMNVTYSAGEGREEMFSLVLPRFRDCHKEWRLYRRIQLEWFYEKNTIITNLHRENDEKYDASLSSGDESNISTDTVLGQLVEEKVYVLAKWTPLKTCDGETVLTLSVPNNANQRTALRLSPTSFRFRCDSYFSSLSENPTVSEIDSLTPKSCLFRLYGYRYTRHSASKNSNSETKNVTEASADRFVSGEVPKNPKIDHNHRIFLGCDMVTCIEALLVSPKRLTAEERFDKFEIWKKRFPSHSTVLPLRSEGTSHYQSTKRRRKDNLITKMFPVISSEESFKTMEKRLRQDSASSSSKLLGKSKLIERDGFRRYDHSSNESSEWLESGNLSDKSLHFPNFSLVSRKRTMTLGNLSMSSEKNFESQSGNSLHSEPKKLVPLSPPLSDNPSFLSNSTPNSNSYRTCAAQSTSSNFTNNCPNSSFGAFPELKFRQHRPIINKRLDFTTQEKSKPSRTPITEGLLTNQSKWLHSLRTIREEVNEAASDKIGKSPHAEVESVCVGGGDGSRKKVGILVVDGSGNGVCLKTDETMDNKEIENRRTMCQEKLVFNDNFGIDFSRKKPAGQVEECIIEEAYESVSLRKTELHSKSNSVSCLLHLVRDKFHRNQVADGNLYGKIVGEKNQSKYYGHVGKEMIQNYGQVIEQMDSFEVDFPDVGLITFVHLPGISNHVSLYKVFSKPRSKDWIPIFHPVRKLLIRPELMPNNRHLEIKKLLICHFNDMLNRINESIEEISVDD